MSCPVVEAKGVQEATVPPPPQSYFNGTIYVGNLNLPRPKNIFKKKIFKKKSFVKYILHELLIFLFCLRKS
jgi:hypothetical protein